jgi:hypothetical protein
MVCTHGRFAPVALSIARSDGRKRQSLPNLFKGEAHKLAGQKKNQPFYWLVDFW